jgi:hypothetical protein
VSKVLKFIKNRLVIFFILLAALILLSGYYSENYLIYEEPPSAETFLLNYPEGQMVGLEGWVSDTSPDGFELYIFHHGQDSVFNVNSNANVSVGNNVAVFGVLSNNTITAKTVLLKEDWMYEFLWGRSIFALFILILVFTWYWKFDFKNWEIIRRK